MQAQTKDQLRDYRKALVVAAEKVVGDHFKSSKDWSPTQLANLIAVCGEASCHEEIANYLRYQGARDRSGIEDNVARAVIAGVEPTVVELPSDELKVGAWHLYAVYLKRAHRFHEKAAKAKGGR
jgi:hypothetical protein